MSLPLCSLCRQLLLEALPDVGEVPATVLGAVGTPHTPTVASHLRVAAAVLGGNRPRPAVRTGGGYAAEVDDTSGGLVARLLNWGRLAVRRLSAP